MDPRYVEIKRKSVNAIRERIFERDGWQCRYCGSKVPPFHVDHVYPVVNGGETTEDNLVTSCRMCNGEKHDTVGIWPKPIGYFDESDGRRALIFKDGIIHAVSMLIAMTGVLLMFVTKELPYIGLMVFGAGMMFVNLMYTKDHLDKE